MVGGMLGRCQGDAREMLGNRQGNGREMLYYSRSGITVPRRGGSGSGSAILD